MSRPDIELALDVRSYERVVLIAGRDSTTPHPSHWHRPSTLSEMLSLVPDSGIVVVDHGVVVTRRTYEGISIRGPRALCVGVTGDENARSMRKLLLSIQPWCDLHSFMTDMGRVVVAYRFTGRPYDRDAVIDMRPGARA